MDEETFVEMLTDEVVTEEIEINETDIKMAIDSVETFMINNYFYTTSHI